MKSVEKKVDFNAHIADLRVTLLREDGRNCARISLKNVSEKRIEGAVLAARGFDYFGDVIEAEGKEDFDLVLEHLDLEPGAVKSGYLIEVDDRIRNLEMMEYSVQFADGTEEIYPGPEYHIYYAECFMADSYKDKPELDELRERDERFCCYPKETEEGWLCACGHLNWSRREICGGCGHERKEIFASCTRNVIAQVMKEKQVAFDERMRRMAEQRKRQDRIATIKFILQTMLLLVVAFAVIYVFLRIRFLK